jgi:hypothetical protein
MILGHDFSLTRIERTLMQRPALIATPAAFKGRRSMEAEPVMDGIEFEHADNDEVERDDIVQQARDNEDKNACDNGDKRRDMGGGDDHDFPLGFAVIEWG